MSAASPAPISPVVTQTDSSVASLTDRAMRRLRLLQAMALLFAVLGGRARGADIGLPLPLVWVAALIVVYIVGVNSITVAGARALHAGRRSGSWIRADGLRVLELALDTALAMAVVVVFGLDGSSLSLAVPLFCVVEAGLRFRLRGAALTWAALAVVALGSALLESHPWSATSGLGQVLEPLAVLLLVGLPTGYLAEHLLAEIALFNLTRRDAQERGELLSALITAGCELAGGDLRQIMGATATAAETIGFDQVEIYVWDEASADWVAMFAGVRHGPRAASPTATDPPGWGGSGWGRPSWGHSGSVQLGGFDGTAAVWVLSAAQVGPELGVQAARGAEAVAVTQLRWGSDGERARILAWAAQPLLEGDPRIEALALLTAQSSAALANAALHQDLAGLKDEFEHRALHDPLTGLANRARLLAEIDWCLTASPETAAVLFCDLDGFKAINDTHGHSVGDAVLVAVARRLTAAAGPHRLVARLGGDEFVVVVPDVTTESSLVELSEALVAQLQMPFTANDLTLHPGVSMGMARVSAADSSAAQVLERADQAMYLVKRRRRRNDAGRRRVVDTAPVAPSAELGGAGGAVPEQLGSGHHQF